jgi:hypothetical protein
MNPSTLFPPSGPAYARCARSGQPYATNRTYGYIAGLFRSAAVWRYTLPCLPAPEQPLVLNVLEGPAGALPPLIEQLEIVADSVKHIAELY